MAWETTAKYRVHKRVSMKEQPKKIAVLGTGAWGYCLGALLADLGHQVTCWTKNELLANDIKTTHRHPHLAHRERPKNLAITLDMKEALSSADVVVEAVTSKGLRPVLEEVKKLGFKLNIPLVITSKGIEQKSDLILPEVAVQIFGDGAKNHISLLSGPGFAEEVSRNLPSSLVSTSYSQETAQFVASLFSSQFFRVYPNSDILGVALGGALKNIIAIACGISDGLLLGTGARAALMTRGLHEMVKLAKALGAKPETLYGLSGMGDLFLTCSSNTSRNYRFGKLLSHGLTQEKAQETIEMVVEGAYTAYSALELSVKTKVPMPITEAVTQILQGKINPKEAAKMLMQRSVKSEEL